MKNEKKEILEKIQNHEEQYYIEATDNHLYVSCGGGCDTEMIAEMITEAYFDSSEKIEKTIIEMVNNGELCANETEFVNPENAQHTVYVAYITTPDEPSPSNGTVSIRRNQSSWEYYHPENYQSIYEFGDYESFEEWRDAEASHLIEQMQHSGHDDYPVSPEDIKSWQSWDDVSSAYDIVR